MLSFGTARKVDYSIAVTFLFILISGFLFAGFGVTSASAMVRIDFEQKYFVHPQLQTWDFSLIRVDDLYHIYYHTARATEFGTTGADTIWHSTSPDLERWDIVGPVITIGQGSWDSTMIWAPEVFHDAANNRYGIAYTAVDSGKNQRISFAYSSDLYNWVRADANPIIVPDTLDYIWDPNATWSNFRDPYIYRENDQWHILVTAKKYLAVPTGVLFHAVSDDLENWVDVGYLFDNDGDQKYNVLESPQYRLWGDNYHLFFGEYDTPGISNVHGRDPNLLSMSSRTIIDNGYAPEVDSFDDGVEIFSRLAVFTHPQTQIRNYVIRLDTLLVSATGNDIEVYKPHPLDEYFEVRSGLANNANPTFGDNPDFRGELSVGMVGNSYYGSAEYYQGPLAEHGSPGISIGAAARGELKSFPFIIEGDKIDLLVGGGYYPESCYVALMDATTDTVIFKETGNGNPLLSPRQWDLAGLAGREAYIKILDDETGVLGFINIDEIIESSSLSSVSENPAAGLILTQHRAFPNPFNPSTQVQFSLAGDLEVQVRIYDLRGVEVWGSGLFAGNIGSNNVSWHGIDTSGQAVPAGIYLYSIESGSARLASGKLALIK